MASQCNPAGYPNSSRLIDHLHDPIGSPDFNLP